MEQLKKGPDVPSAHVGDLIIQRMLRAPRRLPELGLALLSILSVTVVIEAAFRLGAWQRTDAGSSAPWRWRRLPDPGRPRRWEA